MTGSSNMAVIDYFSMLRSVYVDLTTGNYSQGASTITMQTARNMFLTRDKNLPASSRKSS